MEECLYVMLWMADGLMRPTSYSLEQSFEGWAFQNGMERRLRQLASRQLVEIRSDSERAAEKVVFRLTAEGRLRALGGRDPEARWSRVWDGRWRLLLFDLPAKSLAVRTRLRRFLLSRSFGYLQNSVWITPDPVDEATRELRRDRASVESLTVFEGRPSEAASDGELVRGAWNFAEINARYENHRQILAECPFGLPPARFASDRTLCGWMQRERAAWKHAFELDPLLPRQLEPGDYLGRQAWKDRCSTLRRLASLPNYVSIET